MIKLGDHTGNLRERINKHKKWFIIGVIFLIILGFTVSSKFKAIEADKVQASITDVTSTVVEKGTIVSDDSGDIYSEVQGKVKAVYVDEGQTVKKGQTLAEIDVGDIDSQIAQLEGQLRAAEGSEQTAAYQSGQNQIKQQQLAVEQAEVALGLSQSAYDRMQKLFREGAVTVAELEQARADVETKKKSLEQANFTLKSTRGQSQGSKIQYQGQKQSILAQLQRLQTQKQKARIIADSDDVIFARKIQAGDYVTPGTLLFSVGGGGNVRIETYVDSQDTPYLKIGDKVTITFKLPGQDTEVQGKINKIAPTAKTVVSALGISEPKIKINVELSERPKGINIIPGTNVDVTLTTQCLRKVLAVPKEALFSDNGKDFVWEVKNGIASLKQVHKGADGDDLTEIKDGLAKGAVVLLNPHQQELQPGVRIK